MFPILQLVTQFLFATAFYDLPLHRNDGAVIDLHAFYGKKILFVNTASASPHASQYAALDSLQRQYADRLVVILIPSDTFGNEPLAADAVANSLESACHPAFLVGEKMDVKGANKSALYRWLTEKALNGRLSNEAEADFFKFLVDDTGELIGVFGPSVKPASDELTSAL